MSNIAVYQTESKGSDVAISQPLITFGQSGAGRSSHKGFLRGLKVTSGLPALTLSMYSFSEHAKTDEDSKQIHGSNTSHCLRSSQTPSQCSPVLATAEGVLLGKVGARLFWLGQLFTGLVLFPNSNVQDAMLAASQTSAFVCHLQPMLQAFGDFCLEEAHRGVTRRRGDAWGQKAKTLRHAYVCTEEWTATTKITRVMEVYDRTDC